jgi:hypothetical protein
MVTATHSDPTIRQCHARVYAERPRARGVHVPTSKERIIWTRSGSTPKSRTTRRLRYRLEAEGAAPAGAAGRLPPGLTATARYVRPGSAPRCRTSSKRSEAVHVRDAPQTLVLGPKGEPGNGGGMASPAVWHGLTRSRRCRPRSPSERPRPACRPCACARGHRTCAFRLSSQARPGDAPARGSCRRGGRRAR